MPFENRAIRARSPATRIDPKFPGLLAAMLVVFAACFAIGRATDPDESRGEGSPSLQAASRSAARPIRLIGMPAIAIPAITKAAAQPTAKAPQPALAREIFHAPLLVRPLRSDQPRPAPVETPTVAPSPASAPVQSTSGSAGSKGGHAHPTSGEDGSFDSSG
jgi:hypothetical protein